jgi:hypothetical protein
VGLPSGAASEAAPPPAPPLKGRGDYTALANKLAGQTALYFGWRPDDFWNATPAELAAIVAALSGSSEAVDTQKLATLMELFPDG